jgi:multidrug efflux system membrane fusion protein
MTPLEQPVQEYDEFTGRVAAVESVAIRSRVSGYIQSIGFKDGDEVKKGQLLFQIDPAPYQTQVDQAKAQLGQAQAAQNFATTELRRIEPLEKTGGASPQEMAKARDQLAAADATIVEAKSKIEGKQLDLDYASVKSPIAGRVSKSSFSVGNLVSGETLLTNVVSTTPVQVNIDVDERRLLGYREAARKKGTTNPTRIRDANLSVFIGMANEKDFPQKGVIDFVDNQIDPLTGTMRVRAEVDNSKGYLTPGQFVRVRFPKGDKAAAVLVPDRAIGRDQDRKYLLVVDDKNMVEYRTVETGSLFGENRAITQGLKSGERIVVDGLQRARPGQPVTPNLLAPATQPVAAGR